MVSKRAQLSWTREVRYTCVIAACVSTSCLSIAGDVGEHPFVEPKPWYWRRIAVHLFFFHEGVSWYDELTPITAGKKPPTCAFMLSWGIEPASSSFGPHTGGTILLCSRRDIYHCRRPSLPQYLRLLLPSVISVTRLCLIGRIF